MLHLAFVVVAQHIKPQAVPLQIGNLYQLCLYLAVLGRVQDALKHGVLYPLPIIHTLSRYPPQPPSSGGILRIHVICDQHQHSILTSTGTADTLTITANGKAFLHVVLEGAVPNLTISYREEIIERRMRLSQIVLTAYFAGVDIFTTAASSMAGRAALFLTAITRGRGHNPWGSSRVGAIAHLGGVYYSTHYVCPSIGRMAINDELAAFHNHTNFGKDTQRAFIFAGQTYGDVIEELKVRDEKKGTKLISYGEAYRSLTYPIHLLSCDQTGSLQLQIMATPDYRSKLSRLMLKTAFQPPPKDVPAWDALYKGRPFVIGVDMNLRRIDAAIKIAKKRECLPISLAALDGQGDAVLLSRYKDTGLATVYKVTGSILTELLGRPPSFYIPPRTQYLTEKGDVVDAPLIQTAGKTGRQGRK